MDDLLRLIANCYFLRIYLLLRLLRDWLFHLLIPEFLQIFLLDLLVNLSLALTGGWLLHIFFIFGDDIMKLAGQKWL